MKKQILEIINRNGMHIPTVSDFREITKLLYEGKPKDFTAEWYGTTIVILMQRFEELTRGKWVIRPVFKPALVDGIGLAYDATERQRVWQPALLKKEMLVCEVESPSLLKPGHISEMYRDKEAYESAKEKVWFEYRTLNERPTAIDLALSYGEIWKFIKSQDNGNDKWKFTESFVNQLIKP